MPQHERRRSRRFSIRQVTHIICDAGEIEAVTENISSNGVYLITDSFIREGSEVEVIVLLESQIPTKGIRLTGSGRVVRVETKTETGYFGIALGLDRHFAREVSSKAFA